MLRLLELIWKHISGQGAPAQAQLDRMEKTLNEIHQGMFGEPGQAAPSAELVAAVGDAERADASLGAATEGIEDLAKGD